MNCVGVDASKGKSTVAVMRPGGEVVIPPHDVSHTVSELSALAERLKSLDGETRVVIESTGNYHAPIAWWLHDSGFYVSVVNPMLTRNYGDNSVRYCKAKYTLTETGKVVVNGNRDGMKRARRKIKAFHKKIEEGKMSYSTWKSGN